MRMLKNLTAFTLVAAAFVTAHAAPCGPADLNEDGFVDFSDYLEFLNRFDAGDLSVDYTGDGLVDFSDYLEFLNLFEAGCLPACVNGAELAAVPLTSYPFANYVQAYLTGTSVSIAVDPSKISDLTGKTTRVYVTANQSWTSGMPLVDVRGGGFQNVTWPGGTVTASTFALTGSTTLSFDAGEDIGVAYDLIIDENNNGVFDGCDKVDGLGGEGGFYVIRDMTTANAGTAVTALNVTVPAGRVPAGFEDGRWHYPANIASRGQLPLIVIAHNSGAHFTWYDFLAQHLASYGYIVTASEQNTAVGDGVPSTSTTILDHTNTIIALQSTLGGGVLDGHINSSEIYWIGHSRSGEGVAYGWDRLNRGLYTPTGGHALVISSADIKYIQAIAPTDFAGAGRAVGGGTAFTDPGSVDFMLLYGSADGNVPGSPGNPIAWPFDIYERADGRRNAVYIHGADHGDFDCCDFDDFTGPAGTAIGRTAAQAIQKAVTLASLKYYRADNIPCGEVMWRQYESFKPGSTSATATVDYEYKDFGPGRKFVIDDFQTQSGTGVSSSGGAVAFDVTNLTEGQMRDSNSTFTWSTADPFNGMTRARTGDPSNAVVFDYDTAQPSREIEFDVVPAGRDTTAYSFLSFRAAQGTQHPFTTAVLGDQIFEVELEDGSGNTSVIRIGSYGGGIEEIYQRVSGGVAGWQNEFETIRIRLGDFTTEGRMIDLADIVKVRFLFGSAHGTNQGRLALDDVEFVK